MLRGELNALEVTLKVPFEAPAPAGEKIAVKVMLSLIASVTGSVRPLVEKPVPLVVTCEIVTGAPPALVKVSERLLWLPTCTLPNARLAGFGESVP